MAAVTVTAAKVGVADPRARVRNYIANAALNGGVPVYILSTGKAALCTAADATHGQFAGITIPTKNSGYAAGAGQAVEVVVWGEIEGFDLSGLAYGALVYVADDGTFATTAGTKSVPVGKVVPSSDLDSSGNPKKLLMVMVPYLTVVT